MYMTKSRDITINEKIFRVIRNVEKCRKYVWIIIDDGERMLYNIKRTQRA